jgi:hypothetical protein
LAQHVGVQFGLPRAIAADAVDVQARLAYVGRQVSLLTSSCVPVSTSARTPKTITVGRLQRWFDG